MGRRKKEEFTPLVLPEENRWAFQTGFLCELRLIGAPTEIAESRKIKAKKGISWKPGSPWSGLITEVWPAWSSKPLRPVGDIRDVIMRQLNKDPGDRIARGWRNALSRFNVTGELPEEGFRQLVNWLLKWNLSEPWVFDHIRHTLEGWRQVPELRKTWALQLEGIANYLPVYEQTFSVTLHWDPTFGGFETTEILRQRARSLEQRIHREIQETVTAWIEQQKDIAGRQYPPRPRHWAHLMLAMFAKYWCTQATMWELCKEVKRRTKKDVSQRAIKENLRALRKYLGLRKPRPSRHKRFTE